MFLVTFLGGIGPSAGSLFGGVIYQWGGPHLLFFLSAGMMVLCIALYIIDMNRAPIVATTQPAIVVFLASANLRQRTSLPKTLP